MVLFVKLWSGHLPLAARPDPCIAAGQELVHGGDDGDFGGFAGLTLPLLLHRAHLHLLAPSLAQRASLLQLQIRHRQGVG